MACVFDFLPIIGAVALGIFFLATTWCMAQFVSEDRASKTTKLDFDAADDTKV